MTTEDEMSTDDDGIGTDGGFKPRGTVALGALFVALIFLMWFSVYVILLTRGATT
jgi:hypothetical protein